MKGVFLIFLLFVVLCGCSPPPTPSPYSTMTWKYQHKLIDEPWGSPVVEPTVLHYDLANKRQRLEYFDSRVVTLQFYDTMKEYHITPASYGGPSKVVCFSMDISPMNDDMPSPFPSVKDYTYLGQYMVKDRVLDHWGLSFGPLLRELFTDPDTGYPVEQLNFNGSVAILYEDPVNEPQPDSLFTIPPDCQPVSEEERDHPHGEWLAWLLKHGDGSSDWLHPHNSFRMSLFHKNREYIRAHNERFQRGLENYEMALNQLADRSFAEIKATRMGFRLPRNFVLHHGESSAMRSLRGPPPKSMDWRTMGAVSPTKDQGNCGSCWSFSSTSAIESAYFLKWKKMVLFSEQEFVDCSWAYAENRGCDGGNQWGAYAYLVNGNISLSTEAEYLYEECNGVCDPPGGSGGVALSGYVNITAGDVDELTAALAQQPVAVSINTPMTFVFYAGGVYDDPDCQSTPDSLDHAVSAVGYDTDSTGEPYFIVKNSWGGLWGIENGYIRMSRKGNTCGIATAALYPQVA